MLNIRPKKLVQYSVKQFTEIDLYNWLIILVTDSYMALIVGQKHVLRTFTWVM